VNPSQKIVVLDTNVCLDLFVFHDMRWALLLNALKDGTLRAVTRNDCRMEWQIVLTYSHLSLNQDARLCSAAEFDSLIVCVDDAPTAHQAVRLPICSDPDDQKFLELACNADAEILITKDKALLKLAKKTTRAGLFAIMTPDTWCARFNDEGASQLPGTATIPA
jgi:putative PIN family toxin of toxin-antitoxin system